MRGKDPASGGEHASSSSTTHFEVNGRRWRKTDPSIPDALRQELVNELMSARRVVRDAVTPTAAEVARRRVHAAKVALGERGRAWWLSPTPASIALRIDAAVMALLRSRREGATICPSEPARIAGGAAWRAVLPAVRQQAAALAASNEIQVMRRRQVVTDDLTRGVLRYRLTPAAAVGQSSVIPGSSTTRAAASATRSKPAVQKE